MDDPLVARARAIARRAHDGQTDKAGRPYATHPERVAARLDDPGDQVVALLHDVLEDRAGWDAARLVAAGIPGHLVTDVVALTHHPYEPRTRYVDRIRAAGPRAVRVKRADIADNSDPARLAALDETTQDRLRRKYARDLARLDAPATEPGSA
ncbi:hypothetical protein [Angustibacter aerolatus]|uniref:Phosphohydrolase n=1 Tax=Angustibacter aerolatus TaxID=1162965 RepID=A0ABQ6JJ25_9ACTN|nr:hypothetical protein [Angustibacter aerolatus]GMA87109.1 phosphohydrolase [Angustibacter aerolatus]